MGGGGALSGPRPTVGTAQSAPARAPANSFVPAFFAFVCPPLLRFLPPGASHPALLALPAGLRAASPPARGRNCLTSMRAAGALAAGPSATAPPLLCLAPLARDPCPRARLRGGLPRGATGAASGAFGAALRYPQPWLPVFNRLRVLAGIDIVYVTGYNALEVIACLDEVTPALQFDFLKIK